MTAQLKLLPLTTKQNGYQRPIKEVDRHFSLLLPLSSVNAFTAADADLFASNAQSHIFLPRELIVAEAREARYERTNELQTD